MKNLALAAIIVAGVATMSACSSSESTSDSSPSPLPSSQAPLPTNNPAESSVLPPVIVEPDQTTATAQVGNVVVFSVPDPAGVDVTSDNPQVLEVFQGYNDGSASFNPGGTAVMNGTAMVTITNADGSTRQVTVTVS